MSLYEEHPGRAAQQGLELVARTCEEERGVTAPFLQGREEPGTGVGGGRGK